MKTPKPAQAPAPTPLPDEDAIKKNKAKDLAAMTGASGRASTVLSDPDEKLGA